MTDHGDEITLKIPSALCVDGEEIAECIIEAAPKDAAPHIKLKKARVVKFIGSDVPGFLVVLGAGASLWFTKKWADTYLWPIIQRRIDKKSTEIAAWIDKEIDRRR